MRSGQNLDFGLGAWGLGFIWGLRIAGRLCSKVSKTLVQSSRPPILKPYTYSSRLPFLFSRNPLLAVTMPPPPRACFALGMGRLPSQGPKLRHCCHEPTRDSSNGAGVLMIFAQVEENVCQALTSEAPTKRPQVNIRSPKRCRE